MPSLVPRTRGLGVLEKQPQCPLKVEVMVRPECTMRMVQQPNNEMYISRYVLNVLLHNVQMKLYVLQYAPSFQRYQHVLVITSFRQW